ncbi:hypothetical protein [Capnocytophaga granulosa]|jgi:hypothetical protein|uniref:hypothetical protein n=1 Tax=Capnocytophaga granulosa TaxID=45242 RepID=UPI0028D430C5|nr:hypothetical protein [Capnocytophaga granulosa]
MKKVKNSRANRKSKTGDLADPLAEHILSTNEFSLQIAYVMQKTQAAIREAARRRSNTLLDFSLIPLYESYGYSEKDIKKSE